MGDDKEVEEKLLTDAHRDSGVFCKQGTISAVSGLCQVSPQASFPWMVQLSPDGNQEKLSPFP